MKTKDGVEFKLGMTVYLSNGQAVETSQEGWEVEDDRGVYYLRRVGVGVEVDVATLYSSRTAIARERLDYVLGRLSDWTDELIRCANTLEKVMEEEKKNA